MKKVLIALGSAVAALAMLAACNGNKNVTPEVLPDTRQADSLVLVDIYKAIGDGEKVWKDAAKRWDLTKPISEWAGITLNEEGRVASVKFLSTSTGLIEKEDGWELPASVGKLSALTELRVVNCSLKGDALGTLYNKLPKLTTLYLTNNKVSGELTSAIVGWPDLTNCYIDQNPQLAGSIPAEIGQLKKLENLNISSTSIGGAIPAEIAGATALKNFMSFKNKLSGELPDVWDKLPALSLIQIYDDEDPAKKGMNITGGLPASIGASTSIKSIWLYNLNLTGNIPESWGNLPTTVNQIRIFGNKLSGEVPAAVLAHANWESKWNPAQYILPQQEGYGLSLPLAPAEAVSINFGDWAVAKEWENGADYNTVEVNSYITLSASWSDGADHNGVFYEASGSNPSDWRFYQARGGGMTITAKDGKQLVSVTFTYGNKNGGVAVGPDNKQYASGDKCPLSGTSALFTVASTTGASNGQWRIYSMEIEYR